MIYADIVSLAAALLVYHESQEEAHGLRVTNPTPEAVVPFLKRNLPWRVKNSRGEHVPREQIPSLKIALYSEVVTLPESITELPTFGEQTLHAEVTDGRPNGVEQGGEC